MSKGSAIGNDRLQLLFTCCDPALDSSAHMALTLRSLVGLTTSEIARAFLVSEATMRKRIWRAKRKVGNSRVANGVIDADKLADRLQQVLRAIYLIFNEGYSATRGKYLVRGELCDDAIHLGRLLCELMPYEAEAWGLLALMLMHDARRDARVDSSGRYVALDQQDRSLWDQNRIREGMRALERATRLKRVGKYQLQAAISMLHVRAQDAKATDWAQIAELYGVLATLSPSPVVELNRACAIGFAWGAHAGLELLKPLLSHTALKRYQPLHAAHADLLRRAGKPEEAVRAYERAIALSSNDVERAELERRLQSLKAA